MNEKELEGMQAEVELEASKEELVGTEAETETK